jgi:hypothetical protein
MFVRRISPRRAPAGRFMRVRPAGQWGDTPFIHTFANNQESLDNG